MTAGEKTEKATPKRKQDERKKGNVFQSSEVVTVGGLLATFFALKFLMPYCLGAIEKSIDFFYTLAEETTYIGPSEVGNYFIQGCITFAVAALPLLLIASLVATILTLAQTKLLVTMKSVSFKFNRLNPLQGIKKMFSLRSIIELVKAVAKIVILGYIVYTVFLDYIPKLPKMIDMSIGQAAAMTGDMIMQIVQTVAIAAVAVAAFDFLYQWWDYEKNLRMSKQEIKEEYKQTEGDPQIKGKIKERQQQMARRRMMQNVPNADVVIRNPTHYAIAIQYVPEKQNAPVVIAKGIDSLALRIVSIAEEHDIMTVENKPLAHGLYDSVEIDQEIPENFYQAVAEVLAFVYNVKKKDLK